MYPVFFRVRTYVPISTRTSTAITRATNLARTIACLFPGLSTASYDDGPEEDAKYVIKIWIVAREDVRRVYENGERLGAVDRQGDRHKNGRGKMAGANENQERGFQEASMHVIRTCDTGVGGFQDQEVGPRDARPVLPLSSNAASIRFPSDHHYTGKQDDDVHHAGARGTAYNRPQINPKSGLAPQNAIRSAEVDPKKRSYLLATPKLPGECLSMYSLSCRLVEDTADIRLLNKTWSS